jgi:hypothetical protein
MSRQVSPSTNRPYGLLRVTQLWRTARATVYRHRRHDAPAPRRRPGPVGPMPDEDLVAAIRGLLAASPFHGEGYRRSGRGCASPACARPNGACAAR